MKKLIVGTLLLVSSFTTFANTTTEIVEKELPNCDAPEVVLLLKKGAIDYVSNLLASNTDDEKSVSEMTRLMTEDMSFELVNTKEVDYEATANKSMKQCKTDAYMFYKKYQKTANDLVPGIKYQIFRNTKGQLKLRIHEVNNRKI